VYDSCDSEHTWKQFSNLHVALDLDFAIFCMFDYRFSILCFCVSLDQFIPAFLAFVVQGVVSSVPSQMIGWEERLQNDVIRVNQSINQPIIPLTYILAVVTCPR